MFGEYEQEAHVRYRIDSIYESAHEARMARMFRAPRKEGSEPGRSFWDRVAHGFRQTASPA
jgi:hypothetical protein